MTSSAPEYREAIVVMNGDAIGEAITRLAREIVAAHDDIDSLVLLGILRRGRPLADRLAAAIGSFCESVPRVGSLATTLYRDDLRSGAPGATMATNVTHFDFDVEGTTVVLVDDVLATGRTIRAALDEVIDYGRPKRIQLACLVDRGHRELPIQADFLGWSLATSPDDHVSVRLVESDGEDAVLLEQAVARDATGEDE